MKREGGEAERLIHLPAPARSEGMSLVEALQRRRSVREFAATPLAEPLLAQLFWAGPGVTALGGLRTAPSAGALYPLELYVATAGGLFHYDPAHHTMTRNSGADVREELWRAALQQDCVREAPAVFAITAVYARTAERYGRERAARYVPMEAGHAAQNVLLQATALGLGGVPVGAFDDAQVQRALGLPADEAPLYLIPVGHPR
jgi:SagB-type dehydrogenase family enzyme